MMNIFNMLKSLFGFSTNLVVEEPAIVVSHDTPDSTVTPKPSNLDMRYLLNDPSSSDFFMDVKFPQKPNGPNFNVMGLNGGSLEMYTEAWRAAQVYSTLCYTINTMQLAFGNKTRWPGTKVLNINPKAGKDFNAYYDRRNLKFFFNTDPVTKQAVYTAHSTDVISHEMGHAILDVARPDLWSTQAIEVWSFHEAWGDIVAVLTAMKHDKVLERVLEQTGGDLNKSNIVSCLAEEMGTAIYNITKGKGGRVPGRLRDAYNQFNYQVPEKLPANAPDDQLACECHSFGRVFVGAYYEMLANIYDFEVKNGADKLQALRDLRDTGILLIVKAVQIAPATPRFFDAVARAILVVDKKMGGKYQDIIYNTFLKRKILNKRTLRAQSNLKFTDLNLKDIDILDDTGGTMAVRISNHQTIRLADHFGIRAQNNNPLYLCEMDVPTETFLEFDDSGKLTNSIATSNTIAINAARACANYLHNNEMVNYDNGNDDIQKMFAVVENKLVRNHFICGIH